MRQRVIAILLAIGLLTACPSCARGAADRQTEQRGEPVVLTMASYRPRTLTAVTQFNLAQEDYRIELVDYSANGSLTRDDALARLNADLAKGEGPDLFYLWNMGMDVDVYGPKGYLEDLYPYVDEDPALSREDLVQSLLHAYEVNGRLYGVVAGFSVISMFGAKSELEAYGAWNFDALEQLAKSRGGAKSLFSTQYGKADFLTSALSLSTSDFVNLQSGKASFDSANYKSLLSFCNQLDMEPDFTQVNQNPALTFYVLSSFMELQYYEQLYGGEIAFVGYPTSIGNGNCFTDLSEQFAMNANSKNKDGAWAFLKLLLSEQYQVDAYVDSGYTKFPTNIKAMEKLIEKSKSIITATDEKGNEVEMTSRGDQEGFEYHPATDGQISQMLALINNTEKISYAQYDLINIALEEATDYFNGIKSLDEVAAITQQRAATYLAERQ